MRILLDISYIGTRFCGWQSQINGLSVQQVLEEALKKSTGQFMRITGASRTDAGVHARCQRAHFDYAGPVPPDRFPFLLNPCLPPDVRVTGSREVPESLHARFQAAGKAYTYRIVCCPHPNALDLPFAWHLPYALEYDRMREAAALLEGTHDFRAFAASGFQSKTTVKTIYSSRITASDEHLQIRINGSGFLYNMVRIIAGTLVYIGEGRLEPDCISAALASGDRLVLGPTAPPHGLELTRVMYAPEWGEWAREDGGWTWKIS